MMNKPALAGSHDRGGRRPTRVARGSASTKVMAPNDVHNASDAHATAPAETSDRRLARIGRDAIMPLQLASHSAFDQLVRNDRVDRPAHGRMQWPDSSVAGWSICAPL